MKFLSTRLNGKKRLKLSAPFDKAFVRNLTLSDEGSYLFDYNVADIQTKFPVNITSAYFAVTPTDDNIFASAVLYLDDENCFNNKFIGGYCDDYLGLDCEVEFVGDESKKLILYLLSEAVKGDIASLS